MCGNNNNNNNKMMRDAQKVWMRSDFSLSNVSVQYDGGLLPLCDSIGEPFQYHVEFLSLQPMFPPKPFD